MSMPSIGMFSNSGSSTSFGGFDGDIAGTGSCCFGPAKSIDQHLASTGDRHHVAFAQYGIGSCFLNHTVAT